MKRGTTPALLIRVKGIEFKNIKRIIVTIRQKNVLLDYEDQLSVNKDGNSITVYMSQEETLRLKSGSAQLQVRMLLLDETAVASNIVSVNVDEILREGVI